MKPQVGAKAKKTAAAHESYLLKKWQDLPAWRQRVNKAKFSAYFHTQMLTHYLTHRDEGPAVYLDETMLGTLMSSHLKEALPRYLDFGHALNNLQQCKPGGKDSAAAVKTARALLRGTGRQDDLPASLSIVRCAHEPPAR